MIAPRISGPQLVSTALALVFERIRSRVVLLIRSVSDAKEKVHGPGVRTSKGSAGLQPSCSADL